MVHQTDMNNDPNWTESDDLSLLGAIHSRGYGDWEGVAIRMGNTRSSVDCQQRYNSQFVESGGVYNWILQNEKQTILANWLNCSKKFRKKYKFSKLLRKVTNGRLRIRESQLINGNEKPAITITETDVDNMHLSNSDSLCEVSNNCNLIRSNEDILLDTSNILSFDTNSTMMKEWNASNQELNKTLKHNSTVRSSASVTMPGYCAARSEFECDYDNHAEFSTVSIASIGEREETTELEENLVAAVVSCYNNRLKIRYNVHKLIRSHGLLESGSITSAYLSCGWERFTPFAHLFANAPEFHYIMAGLHHAYELRRHIARLQELRREAGIKKFNQCRLYQNLKHYRETCLKERRLDCAVTVNTNFATDMASSACRPRQPAPPLDIVALPGYDKLNVYERELCSDARIVPESYLIFRKILEHESAKNGGTLKLSQARQLIKIDVNKTRKLFDFLVRQGFFQQAW